MTLDDLLARIRALSRPGKGFRPHKYVAVLTVIQLVRSNQVSLPEIRFDGDFQAGFRKLMKRYRCENDRNRPHTPFFHLSSSGFWRLVAREGKADELSKTSTVGSAGQLVSLVSHAVVDESVCKLLAVESTRDRIEDEVRKLLANGLRIRAAQKDASLPSSKSTSLFAHEQQAIDAITRSIERHKLGHVLPNLDIHDPQSNRYFETDIVVVACFGIFVVELKHWSGRVEIRPNSWIQNDSYYKKDPHRVNSFKAKLIRGLFERRFPTSEKTFVESVVVFTNPESSVTGSSTAHTDKNDPTFDSIDRFIDYLKLERNKRRATLRQAHVGGFVSYLEALNQTPRPRDFVFPGYEIVERLYQHTDRAEFVARPTEYRHRRLSRLRIFFPQPEDSRTTPRVAHERATATLNAMAKIGDHPNILKVWPVPNEDGLVVEGSDWSEAGTLQDYLEREERLDSDVAIGIAAGILRGLEAVHREDVIHRALSPEAILMDGETPKLMNFDLSYQLEEDRTTVIPDVAELKMSPYVAPEVYSQGPLTEAADLFSVGVTIYRMLTGERPFGCSTDLQRLGGHLGEEHRTKLQHVQAPNQLIKLVTDLVRLVPGERPGDTAEVLKRLSEEASEVDAGFRPINPDVEPGAAHDVYEIDALVARGAESQVYRARGPQGRFVLIKLFDADVPMGRVVNEQEMAACVRHPSIVKVESLHRWQDGRFYLPFEWLSGRSLREEIENSARPDLTRFTQVAKEMLDALTALHSFTGEDGALLPILHNDIKPGNVILSDGGRAVFIDFGSASHPQLGLYEGTEGYVAPDLRLGQERCYSEDGDLFSLGVTLFEWLFGASPYDQLATGAEMRVPAGVQEDVPLPLIEWFAQAVATELDGRFLSAVEMSGALAEALATGEESEHERRACPRGGKQTAPPAAAPEQLSQEFDQEFKRNPFVAYLNSLQSRDAASENALAESQARSPLFSLIHVPHPLSNVIERTLLEDQRNVILTGHAGDGKSTIGIELYKRLCLLPDQEPLDHELPQRASVEFGKQTIVIIKDLSEWPATAQQTLLGEAVKSENSRFLIISNTGTLLDTFRECEREGDWADIEDRILECLESPTPEPLEFLGAEFSVINLSMIDNLALAEDVLCRVVSGERWEQCSRQDCSKYCPILRNVQLLRSNSAVARRRLFLAYRRLFEYGTRLTLRQLTAHVAYMITAGLSCHEIAAMSQQSSLPRLAEFMFFNRFFGDDGLRQDMAAAQLAAIRHVCEANLGTRPCPSWERRLWTRAESTDFAINARDCQRDFESIRAVGSRVSHDERMSPVQARTQARRMLYFLHDFGKADDGMFVRTFLDSPMILAFSGWQEAPGAVLSLGEKANLKQRVLHVLQEHFTGVRLPEGSRSERELYVTLSRRSSEVRQSAQVVLVRLSEDDLGLDLHDQDDGLGGSRRTLVLEGKRFAASLSLDLPFLDYVMMRHQGDVGNALLPSYVNRLDRFRGRIIRHAEHGRSDDVMLVRLRTNHTFRRQVIAVRDAQLEVTDG